MVASYPLILPTLSNLLPRIYVQNGIYATLRNSNRQAPSRPMKRMFSYSIDQSIINISSHYLREYQSFQFLPLAISISVHKLFGDLWESILRAVPKKKTSHSKKRSRQRAGKALKDVTALNRCSGCGHIKRSHVLCPYCVKGNRVLPHVSDIFSLAVTPKYILSTSGASEIKIYSTKSPETPLFQTLSGAHKIGCHHIATSRDGRYAVSAGFGGEVKVWKVINIVDKDGNAGEEWAEEGCIISENKAGEIWAIALSEDGQYLASTSYDGRINVWDLVAERTKIREFETNGSFGMCLDISRDGRLTASGHENGTVYVFNNETGRMIYSLPGLVRPVRTVAFSPGGSRLGAAGDAGIIALYDVKHGEQVANFTGNSAWIFSLDWSKTGEYLLSGSSDGKVRVWSIDQRSCVTTHGESGKALWSVKWLPNTGRSEKFVTAGANRSISLYREATGG
ncbi:Meiotic recombination protein rec14 [Erysiphe neolycopersici]|uniref:Mitochondrial division protein 1 n=1 Tax=Erysiphe neolycopersici TaxID=212602 RepID=A0A420HNC5_9PEZI|nr:Meiotic recombination protein rec14 [Erysiphe neolycopersici]